MEKHTCKLCSRHFSNGRALGGHMRSHVTAVSAPTKPRLLLDSSSSPLAYSSSTSSREEEEEREEEATAEEDAEEKEMGLGYGLRENPKKSFRLVDPEFSSSFAAVEAGSSVVQDRESETESSRAPSNRRRSKRSCYVPPPPEAPELEPASSVSDTTPEEDVARCLMLLSRDIWTIHRTKTKSPSVAEEEAEQLRQQSDGFNENEDERVERMAARPRRSNQHQSSAKGRSKYQCGTCKKVFRSYQALGGHRASHKKVRGCLPAEQIQIEDADSSEANGNADGDVGGTKSHECPVCFRLFNSGQALGGHKRSHLSSSNTTITITSSSLPPLTSPPSTCPATAAKFSESWIDLNLPAPMEEDVELSAVSDAGFVFHHHQPK